MAHRLLHATVGPAFQRLQLPHPSHLEPSPVSSLNWAGRPVPLVIMIRHWEVTARVHTDFLSFFSILFDFSDLFTDLARACLGLLGASVELVVRPSTYGAHNRSAA